MTLPALKYAASLPTLLIVRSPFGAKHHVVVQYMAAGLKCPLCPLPHLNTPPAARPHPLQLDTPPPQTAWLVEDKEDKEELMNKEELTTLPTLQGTSHCSCLEHCFLLTVFQ